MDIPKCPKCNDKGYTTKETHLDSVVYFSCSCQKGKLFEQQFCVCPPIDNLLNPRNNTHDSNEK